jgi:hypothetical protein
MRSVFAVSSQVNQSKINNYSSIFISIIMNHPP